MMRGLKEIITKYAAKNGKISKESVAEILDITDLKRSGKLKWLRIFH